MLPESPLELELLEELDELDELELEELLDAPLELEELLDELLELPVSPGSTSSSPPHANTLHEASRENAKKPSFVFMWILF